MTETDESGEDFDDFLEDTEVDIEVDDAGEQKDEERIPTTAENVSVGHVTASDGLRVGRQNHEVSAYVTTGNRNAVRVGDYMQIPYHELVGEEHAELLAEVNAQEYAQRADIEDKSDIRRGVEGTTIDERRYIFELELDPIAVVEGEEEDDFNRSQVDRVPKPFTRVYEAENEEFLRTGLNLPSTGPFVGYLAVSGEPRPRDKPLTYRLPDGTEGSEPAIYTHVLLAGSTGKGKTHFTKNFLRQLCTDTTYEIEVPTEEEGERSVETRQRKLCTVIIDPENEYTGLGEDPEDVSDAKLNEYRDDGIEVGGVNTGDCPSHDLTTFIPEVEGTRSPAVSGSHEFGIPFELVEDNIDLIIPYEAKQPTASAIGSYVNGYFSHAENNGEEPTYEGFIDYVDEDPDGLADTIHDSAWDAMRGRIEKAAFYNVFDTGTHSLTDITHEIFDPGNVSVIPTSHIHDKNEESLVVMSLLSTIVRNKIGGEDADKNIAGTPLLVCVDEAHRYLSGPSNFQERSIISDFRQVAKQGRKYDLGLMAVTQKPQDIDGAVQSQMNTRVFLGLDGNDADKIEIPSGYRSAITNFRRGQAIVKSPDVRPVEVLGLGDCVVKHDS